MCYSIPRSWREIAEQVSQQQDTDRLFELAIELSKALDEQCANVNHNQHQVATNSRGPMLIHPTLDQ